MASLSATLEQRVAERTFQFQTLNRELGTFTHTIAHDLKSPLRSIEGFMHLLQEQTQDRIIEEDLALMERVMSSTRRMHGLLSELLALARVSQAQLQRGEVNLSEVAEELMLLERLRDPGRKVEVQIEPGLVADCDARLAKIALENLLGNAW